MKRLNEKEPTTVLHCPKCRSDDIKDLENNIFKYDCICEGCGYKFMSTDRRALK